MVAEIRSGRLVSRTVALVFAVSMIAFAQDTAAQKPDRSTSAKTSFSARQYVAPSAAAIALLRKRVENVDWEEVPFEEVIAWLKDEAQGQVNLVPRWGPLSVESVDRDSLVSLQLNNTTVADVLTETLDSLSDDAALSFHAVGNKMTISTRADFDRKLYVRVYDATDLLIRFPDFGQAAPNVDLQNQQRQGGGGGGGGGGQGVFSGGSGGGQEQNQGGEQAEQEMEERLQDLSTLITTTIAPASWSTPGGAAAGGAGTIAAFNRNLIVLNTIEVHEQIAGVFAYD